MSNVRIRHVNRRLDTKYAYTNELTGGALRKLLSFKRSTHCEKRLINDKKAEQNEEKLLPSGTGIS